MKVAKAIGIPLLLAGVALAGSANAALVSRNFEWVGVVGLNGNNPGYTASGTFTYDDSFAIVEAEGALNGNFNNGLDALTISFFDDTNALLGTFNDVVAGVSYYDFLTFQFDTATQQFTNLFDMGQDAGNIYEYYIAGTIGGQSWLVESDSLNDLNSIAHGTSIAVTSAPAVPVPAAAWLFGTGLAGLVGVARRNGRTA
ncbi:MAG: VPLPA-CTERM sorting domain-containing protein [Gammaproteobacteria bacterium]|nr:VPLPA-CTERM sorting domain-containing protein [Gammaproteobacteria bacterium]